MELAVGFAALSAVLYALTVVIDKLTLSDFYSGNVKQAWFISSTLGALIGIVATLIGWWVVGDFGFLLTSFESLLSEHFLLTVLMITTGAVASLSLPLYFKFIYKGASTTAALAVAATPAFVFATQKILFGEVWLFLEVASVIVAVTGFILYEWVEYLGPEEETSATKFKINWPLVGFIVADTAYLVMMENTLSSITTNTGLGENATGLVAMPLFWLGFGIGFLCLLASSVRKFIGSASFWRWRFIILILTIETIGGLFYYFELLGVAGLDVAYATLIIGAHVILVYCTDLIIRNKLKTATGPRLSLLFFKVPVSDLEAYRKSRKQLWLQFGTIIIVLIGLALWP